MKKLLAVLIVCVMLTAMIPAASVFAVGETEGPFKPVYTGSKIKSMSMPRDPDDEEDESVTPLAGYHYDSKGFHMDSPVYTKVNRPYSVVATTETYDLTVNNDAKGGHVLSLKFTVDNYLYNGNAGADQWIALGITDKPNVNPGSAEFQDGWFTLIRGNGDGNCRFEPALDYGNTFVGSPQSTVAKGNAPLVDGKETFEFYLDYDNGAWTMTLNGFSVTAKDARIGTANQNSVLDTFKNQAYFTIITQTGYIDEEHPEANLIELSITEFNGEVPYGDDSAEPVSDDSTFAPIEDPSTVAQNMPAVKWDSEKTTSRVYSGFGFEFSDNYDGTVHVISSSTSPYINWGIKKQISYDAKDFPVIAVLSKNVPTFSGNCYYSAGSIIMENADCIADWDPQEIEFDDEWTLGFIDLTDVEEWAGRINNIRVGFNDVNPADEDDNNWDIGFMGCFRNADEAMKYAEAYLTGLGVEIETAPEETAEAVTTGDDTTAAETEPEVTTAGIGDDNTTAAEQSGPTDQTTSAEGSESGCGGYLGGLALISLFAAACVTLKKKN